MKLESLVARLSEAVDAGGRDAIGHDDVASLARLLIASEVAPGGPYRGSDGHVTQSLNRSIARLLRRLQDATPRAHSAGPLTRIQASGRDLIESLPAEMRIAARHVYKRILKIDRAGEISEIAALFAASLPGVKSPTALTDRLGVANLMVWTAYSLYDDIVDSDTKMEIDKGSDRSRSVVPLSQLSSLLPIANVAHRLAITGYLETAGPSMRETCLAIFDGMDAANTWEVKHCRFEVTPKSVTIGRLPRYGTNILLAQRARAHVLGPLIINCNITKVDPAVLGRALDQYLIARQFNDDLHDWIEDLGNGHISPVVARLLVATGRGQGTCDRLKSLADMKKIFWSSELEVISRYALRRIRESRRLLCSPAVGMAADAPFITAIIAPIDETLVRGLARHAADKRFLEAYRLPASTIAR